MLAVSGEYFDGGVGRVDVASVILQPDVPTDEAPVISAGGAVAVGAAAKGHWRKKGCREKVGERDVPGGRPARSHKLNTERLDPLATLREPRAEIAVVIGARRCGAVLGRFDGASRTIKLQSAIGGSEIDANANENRIGSGVIVLGRLLGTVAHAVDARPLDELRIRRVKLDLGDIRPGFGGRQGLEIRSKKVGRAFVVALAKEVGVADGFVGEGRLKREDGQCQK